MPDTSTGRNQETERGEPTAQRAWGPIGKKDRNRSRFPFYGEKEIWNTSSLLVGWKILEIVPCRNKVRVESSGDSRNIHWICVSNIMQYTYIYIYTLLWFLHVPCLSILYYFLAFSQGKVWNVVLENSLKPFDSSHYHFLGFSKLGHTRPFKATYLIPLVSGQSPITPMIKRT